MAPFLEADSSLEQSNNHDSKEVLNEELEIDKDTVNNSVFAEEIVIKNKDHLVNFKSLDSIFFNTFKCKYHHKKQNQLIKKYIHWLSVHLASLQVLDILDVVDGFCLPDLSSWSEHFCKDDNLKSRSRR